MIIEQIKEAIRIEDLIGQTHTVTGRGPTLTTVEHDSLKIFTRTNSWYWYSIGKGGDVLDWYQHQHGCDLATAIDECDGADHRTEAEHTQQLHCRCNLSGKRADRESSRQRVRNGVRGEPDHDAIRDVVHPTNLGE